MAETPLTDLLARHMGEPPPGVVVCGGLVCASGQECCLLTATCVAVGDPSCAPPAGTTDPAACARNSDCAVGELCDVASDSTVALCGGALGRCRMARPPADCGGFGTGVCGCDGRTYADPCAASRAGVRVSRAPDAPCGIDVYSNGHYACDAMHDCFLPRNAHCDLGIGECVREHPFVMCGVDSQCPAGEQCCGITGACYDPATPASCAVPPPGTLFPCANDEDCARWDGSYWGDGLLQSYCDGPSPDGACGMAGGCRMAPSSCNGILAPVCGCDGNTYQNECEAQRVRVRIAHTGSC